MSVAEPKLDRSELEPWTNNENQSIKTECAPADLAQAEETKTSEVRTQLPTSKSTPPLSSTISEDLREDMYDYLVESVFDGGGLFLPAGSLQKLLTPENIRRELQGHADDSQELQTADLVDYIRKDAKILFAILVYLDMDLTSVLPTFREYGLTDKHLPIQHDLIECAGKDRSRSRGSVTTVIQP